MSDDHTSKLVMTNIFTIKDSTDKFLLEKILAIVGNTMTLNLISAWCHVKEYPEENAEKYHKKIVNTIRSLIKANHNRRVYKRLVGYSEKRLLKESVNAQSSIDLIYEEPDLMSEIDSFLVNIKAALDSLATSLNPIFGTRIDGWHKKGKKSGVKIINTLNNLPADLAERTKDITMLMDDNIEYISYLVALRDSPTHRGNTANVTPFRFSVATGKIERPKITHNPDTTEDVSVFLDRTILSIGEFIQAFIVHSLSNLITDMVLMKDKKDNFTWQTDPRIKRDQ